ncbi:MMPL family transporter [Aquihabitans sp. G128]|uniref:MMPL family transporter n=1 Tax=Aquihabitans sp. G128 TaxID=2849779 RepID=UPI001C24F134|nr:MMPL family transporter [Aquihabitans sp. G128]QXC61517.1 MMPL family transporter [Aquihabitans sp. G128]
MKKFWSNLAVQLGKRAGAVSVVGLVITLVLGLGISQLKFATGQDSYLNKGDQVAKDNVSYQKLFGGQIMLVLFTMDDGHKVDELASAENQKAIEAAKKEILSHTNEIEAVLTPLDTLDFSANLLSRTPDAPGPVDPKDPNRNPKLEVATALGSIASSTINAAIAAEKPGSEGEKVRKADLAETTERITPFLNSPESKRSLDNPEWVDVLLRDNRGKIRKPLLSSFFDDTHAQMIVRLKGNADVVAEGKGADIVKAAWADRDIKGGTTLVTGAPVLLKDINDYLRGGILKLGALAVAIMIVILLLFFKVRWRLLPLGVVLIGVIWAFGLAGWIGIPLTIVTIAGLPVMLGVGIDYAIQMHAHRGGGDHRPCRAPHPGDRPEPGPRPAGGHVRRPLRLRRPALRQGPDDP